MSQEQDKVFFRNYTIVIAILAAAMVLFFILAQMFGTDEKAMADREAKRATESTAKMMEDTAPMGEVSVQGEADEMEAATEEVAAAKSGEEVYNGMCIACHSVPGIGAPVVGTAADWTDRIAQGNDVMYDNAINGFTGPSGAMMPARGGGQFSDDEVKAAVDYMVENSQ